MIRCINLTAQLLNPLIRFFESFHGGKLIYLASSCQLIRPNDHPRKPVANPGEGPRGPGGPGSPLDSPLVFLGGHLALLTDTMTPNK